MLPDQTINSLENFFLEDLWNIPTKTYKTLNLSLLTCVWLCRASLNSWTARVGGKMVPWVMASATMHLSDILWWLWHFCPALRSCKKVKDMPWHKSSKKITSSISLMELSSALIGYLGLDIYKPCSPQGECKEICTMRSLRSSRSLRSLRSIMNVT